MDKNIFIDRYSKPHILKSDTVMNRVGVFALIYNGDDEVLFVRPKGSTVWELPGGGVDAGEHEFEALVREVKEETNLDVIIQPGKLEQQSTPLAEKVVPYFADDVSLFWNYTVKLYNVSCSGKLAPSAEIEEVRWFSNVSLTETWINYLHRELLAKYPVKVKNKIEMTYDDILGYTPVKNDTAEYRLTVNVWPMALYVSCIVVSFLLTDSMIGFSGWDLLTLSIAIFLNIILFIGFGFWMKVIEYKKIKI